MDDSGAMRRLLRVTVAVIATSAAACGSSSPQPPAQPAQSSAHARSTQINGAGATFPNPIYSKWFAEYTKLHPDVRFDYQPIGSGGGVRQLTNRTVFFGASDMPMTEDQLQLAPGPILHIPSVLGAVVPIYNLQGATDLSFTGTVLANIYLGKIRTWNDPAIARVNPGVMLPGTDITVVHRADASGTTFIFVDYLAKISPEFQNTVGVNSAVDWPVGIGGKGNEGVSALVSQTPGAIGYVELVHAMQNGISFGAVQSRAGDMVKASPESVTKAAAGAVIPDDFRVSITNAPGAGAYPLSSFTWLLLYTDPPDKTQARALNEFVKWALTDGQQFAADFHFARLPQSLVARELKALETIKTN
jgi:phosphate transport system substrate-binding protein